MNDSVIRIEDVTHIAEALRHKFQQIKLRDPGNHHARMGVSEYNDIAAHVEALFTAMANRVSTGIFINRNVRAGELIKFDEEENRYTEYAQFLKNNRHTIDKGLHYGDYDISHDGMAPHCSVNYSPHEKKLVGEIRDQFCKELKGAGYGMEEILREFRAIERTRLWKGLAPESMEGVQPPFYFGTAKKMAHSGARSIAHFTGGGLSATGGSIVAGAVVGSAIVGNALAMGAICWHVARGGKHMVDCFSAPKLPEEDEPEILRNIGRIFYHEQMGYVRSGRPPDFNRTSSSPGI